MDMTVEERLRIGDLNDREMAILICAENRGVGLETLLNSTVVEVEMQIAPTETEITNASNEILGGRRPGLLL